MYNVFMKKLAIVLDSFNGKNEQDLKNINENIHFLPLKAIFDGVEYLDGIDETPERLIDLSHEAEDVKTSQPSPATMEDLFSKLSEEYENVIYFPLNKSLSGTIQTARMITNDMDNVHIIDNWMVGEAFTEISKWLLRNEDKDINILLEKATDYGKKPPTYIVPKDNESFIKSGRLGKAQAFILEKLHSVPVICYNGELSKKIIKRSGKKAISFAVKKIKEYVESTQGKFRFVINRGTDKEFLQHTIDEFVAQTGEEPLVQLSCSLIAVHTGNGALGIGAYELLED